MNQADPDLPSQMDNLSMNSHGKRAKSMVCWTSHVSPLHMAHGHWLYMSMPQLTVRGAAWTWLKKPQTQNTHTSGARLYDRAMRSTQNSVIDTIKSWLRWWVCKCSKSLRTVSSQTLPCSSLFCGEELFTIKSQRFGSSLDTFSFEEYSSFFFMQGFFLLRV